jgi:Ras-related GTP-binding protein C/D
LQQQQQQNSNNLRPVGFDQDSSAVITLRTRQVIFLRQINMYLALVCVIKEENFERQGLIDFNFNVFKQVFSGICKVKGAHMTGSSESTRFLD